MCSCFNLLLPKNLCGFCQEYEPNIASWSKLKKKKNLDNKPSKWCSMSDLFKCFDCLNYNPLIAKPSAEEFDNPVLTFVYRYLSGHKEET